MPNALVVADDLTGANDTGHGFAARGYEVVVRLDSGLDVSSVDVLVVNTDSRYASAAEARQRVRDAVAGTDAAVVYKKVDSTLRGNLGPEIEAAMAAMNADAAAVAPAFPSNGRTTVCGYHLVDGALVTDTDAGTDPDAPVTDPRLPDYLREQGASGVTHIGVGRVARSDPDLRGALDTGRVVTLDAVVDDHLEAVATAVADAPRRVLHVGCGGLAEHVRVPGPANATRPARRDDLTGTALGVAGSVSPRTLGQLDALPDECVIPFDASRAVTDPEGASTVAADACLSRLSDAPTAVLASATTRTDVDAVLDTAANAGVDERDARERVTAALGEATRRIWEVRAPDGLFCTGGAVATGVLAALDAAGIELRGESVAMGVPVGAVRGGRADGTPLVTKAGAFGDDDTIRAALRVLRRVPKQETPE
ncbi:four-carbon acid sugar kinase family protein [Halarchaeum salinum]|uniref:Four-carbon acid sugar kinase family protein n=1 Tax=Halarchaeum salinum TaxID=489912 RepID=A0AAV3SBK1_9EURY